MPPAKSRHRNRANQFPLWRISSSPPHLYLSQCQSLSASVELILNNTSNIISDADNSLSSIGLPHIQVNLLISQRVDKPV